jgi:predicted nucleic acid-binding protein
MKVVVADASPINYLILIDCIDVLHALYGRVVIPTEVLDELTADGAPATVRSWIRTRPDWIDVEPAPEGIILDLILDAGEAAAIRLALAEPDCLLLLDESEGLKAASKLRISLPEPWACSSRRRGLDSLSLDPRLRVYNEPISG